MEQYLNSNVDYHYFLHPSNHKQDVDGNEAEHIYWETPQGKGKSDGVGGVLKHKAAMTVVKKRRLTIKIFHF